jgi:molybdopterin/thiamine biosynthesis adenylyltransferase
MLRYEKNKQTISDEEQQRLAQSKVCIVGLGGLGGYVLEMLARIGIGSIRAIDGDIFDETNLNRQLLCNSDNIGKPKTEAADIRMRQINEHVNIEAVYERLTQSNAETLLSGCEVIIDACDSVETRLTLEKAAETLGLPLIHGAISGWYAHISTIFPGDRTLSKFYKTVSKCSESVMGNPSFTPAAAASVQVSLVIKYLLKKGKMLRNKMLIMDLYNNEFEVIEI